MRSEAELGNNDELHQRSLRSRRQSFDLTETFFEADALLASFSSASLALTSVPEFLVRVRSESISRKSLRPCYAAT
jgi:hypothetical protein